MSIKKMGQNYINQILKKKHFAKMVVLAAVVMMALSQTAGQAAAELSNAEKREMVDGYTSAVGQGGVPYGNEYLESVKGRIGVDTAQEAKDILSKWAQELAGTATNSPTAKPSAAAELSNAEKREMVEELSSAAGQGAPYVERYLESVKGKLGVDTTQEAKEMIFQFAQELAGTATKAPTNTPSATDSVTNARTEEEEEEGLSALTTAAIVGVVAIAVIAGICIFLMRKRKTGAGLSA